VAGYTKMVYFNHRRPLIQVSTGSDVE